MRPFNDYRERRLKGRLSREERIALGTLSHAERQLRKANVVEALADGAENLAEAAFSASTTVSAIGLWRRDDPFFNIAIDRAMDDGVDLYADAQRADAAYAQAQEDAAA